MQRFGFKLAEIRCVLQLWILPSDTGAPSPYGQGSRECLREGIKLGEKKLESMNEQIRSSIQLRDELQESLNQIRALLTTPPPQKAQSDRARSSASAAIPAS
jgi:MerR, DNA binding